MSYIENLIKNCVTASQAKPINTYEVSSIEEITQLPKMQRAIYVIKLIEGDITLTFNDFVSYKATKQRKCAKINKENDILYVGSSTTGLVNRLKQHLGYGHSGTYALHLSEWFTGKITITIYEYIEDIQVLQIVEDDLSHELKPAFGKQGGNNK